MDAIWTFKQVIGILLIYTGILDGWKYFIQGKKIKLNESAKGFSRRFMNYAIFPDMVRLLYAVIIKDIYIFIISIIALGFMIYMWEQIRIFYPYKNRSQYGFKRPNIFVYIINSILPNSLRRRL